MGIRFGKKSKQVDKLKAADDAVQAAVEAANLLLRNPDFVRFRTSYEEAEKLSVNSILDVSATMTSDEDFERLKSLSIELNTIRKILDDTEARNNGL